MCCLNVFCLLVLAAWFPNSSYGYLMNSTINVTITPNETAAKIIALIDHYRNFTQREKFMFSGTLGFNGIVVRIIPNPGPQRTTTRNIKLITTFEHEISNRNFTVHTNMSTFMKVDYFPLSSGNYDLQGYD
eukprot:PhF_6_TR32763/c0_g2_i1/m.48321